MGAPLAISAVSEVVGSSSKNVKTIALNPTSVGNLYILQIVIESSTSSYAPSAVTGGNCTWTEIGNIDSTSIGDQISSWMGVATATGSSTATLTSSGGSQYYDMVAEQFTCASVGATTTWIVDSSNTQTNTSNKTVTYPTLSPSGSNRMYVGNGCGAQSNSATGQTSGYTVDLDAEDNALIFNTSVSALGSQAPTTQQTSAGVSITIGALIYAMNPATQPPGLYDLNVPAMRTSIF